MTHFDFLVSVSKAAPEDAAKLLKEATDEQIEALVICLSLRTQVVSPPVSKKELQIITRLKRSRRAKTFLLRTIKLLIPTLTIVLSNFVRETLDSICDLS